MSTSGLVDRLLIRLMSLSISTTRCQTCSRLPFKQQFSHNRLGGATKRSTSFLNVGSHSPFLLRSYSTFLTCSSILPRLPPIAISRSYGTDHPRQRDATTSIAILHCAKQNDPDQCLQHYLQLLRTQGKLPSHEALHQLARVLYRNQHVSGFSILHDTLLAYYTLHPLSGKQSRNLTYIYTMLINLIIRKPNNTKRKQQSNTSPPSVTTLMENKTATIIKLCQEMRQLGLPATPAFYNTLLKFCVMKKDAELAWNFFNELAATCQPTLWTFSILLNIMRQQRDTKRTLWVLDAMDQTAIVPDRAIASTMMLILCDQKQYTQAADLVHQLAHQFPQLIGPVYKSVLMKTLHRHYCQHGPAAAARQRHRLAKRKEKRKQARRMASALAPCDKRLGPTLGNVVDLE